MTRPLTIEMLREQACIPSFLWDVFLDWSRDVEVLGEAHRRELESTLPFGLRCAVRFICFDGDVLNGGFAQFLYNHTPREVLDTLDVLKLARLDESAAVLEDAIAICRDKYAWPEGANERWLDGPTGDEPEFMELDGRRCNDESSQRDFERLDTFLRTRLEDCIP